jgi:hypothetical protein
MKLIRRNLALLLTILLPGSCVTGKKESLTVKQATDNIVTRLYKEYSEKELNSMDNDAILNYITPEERTAFATQYKTFDVNVPVTVSVMRHVNQPIVPFWLPEAGFVKTDMRVKNQEYEYEVWQKDFEAGKVELGINGFDMHRVVYFVTVGAKNAKDKLEITNVYPDKFEMNTMQKGAFMYHDWNELHVMEMPVQLKGHKQFTTIRGRAREAHLIKAFRTTEYKSSEKPDQILLTWSKDPKTTQNIQWRTSTDIKSGVVRYWEESSSSDKYTEVKGNMFEMEDRLLQNDRFINRHNVFVEGLKPGTTYNYIVGDPDTDNWSEQCEFITAPGEDKPFSFVWFGDTHKSATFGQLIDMAYEKYPEAAFYTVAGDNVSTGLYRTDWDIYFNLAGNVVKNRPMMPSLGNHDNQDGLGTQMYLDLFALPENGPTIIEKERAYSFEYSNALFIMLDPTAPKPEQAKWLENILKNSDAKWKIAEFHFPPYSYEEDYPEIRKEWGTLFDKYHVDMVFSGHTHYFMRSKPMYNQKPVASTKEGTIYMISAAVDSRDHERPDREWVDVRFSGKALYQVIEIDGDKLVQKAYNVDGELKDKFVITK